MAQKSIDDNRKGEKVSGLILEAGASMLRILKKDKSG